MREAGDGIISLVYKPGGHVLAFEAMPKVVIHVSSALNTVVNYTDGQISKNVTFLLRCVCKVDLITL